MGSATLQGVFLTRGRGVGEASEEEFWDEVRHSLIIHFALIYVYIYIHTYIYIYR